MDELRLTGCQRSGWLRCGWQVADGSTLQPHTVTVKGQQLHERGVYRGSVAEIRRHTAAQVVDAKMAQVEVTVPAEYLHRLEEHCRRPSGPAVGDASTR